MCIDLNYWNGLYLTWSINLRGPLRNIKDKSEQMISPLANIHEKEISHFYLRAKLPTAFANRGIFFWTIYGYSGWLEVWLTRVTPRNIRVKPFRWDPTGSTGTLSAAILLGSAIENWFLKQHAAVVSHANCVLLMLYVLDQLMRFKTRNAVDTDVTSIVSPKCYLFWFYFYTASNLIYQQNIIISLKQCVHSTIA